MGTGAFLESRRLEQHKESVAFSITNYVVLVIAVTFFWVIYVFAALMTYVGNDMSFDESVPVMGEFNLIWLVGWLFCFVLYAVFYFNLVCSLWESIPDDFTRVTPRTAAVFSFIPVFHWLWMFVVFGDLYRAMNKVSATKGFGVRFNTPMIMWVCVGWFTLDMLAIFGQALHWTDWHGVGMGISLVCAVLWCWLTISVFRRIRSDVTVFLEHTISHKDEDTNVTSGEKKRGMKQIFSEILNVGCTLVLILLAITLFLSFWWYMIWMLTSFISVAFGVQWEIWTPWWIHFLYWF